MAVYLFHHGTVLEQVECADSIQLHRGRAKAPWNSIWKYNARMRAEQTNPTNYTHAFE